MKKGEVSMPFHWAYVLIAGAIILLFFIGVVMKQKTASERKLSLIVLNSLEGLFLAASLDETPVVNTPTIPNVDLYFVCDEEGHSFYRVNEPYTETQALPFFGPEHVETSKLVTWRLNFNMPFKAIDFLMIGSTSISYIIVYDDGASQMKEMLMEGLPSSLRVVEMTQNEFLQGNFNINEFVKIIMLTSMLTADKEMPTKIAKLPDENVRAVKVLGDEVLFYKKEGNRFVDTGDAVKIIGGFDEKNPALYSAIFSDSDTFYKCNMAKAYRRLALLAEIFKARAEVIRDSVTETYCQGVTSTSLNIFDTIMQEAKKCEDGCNGATLYENAEKLRQQNGKLKDQKCLSLY